MKYLIIDDDIFTQNKIENMIHKQYPNATCDIWSKMPEENKLSYHYSVIIIDILLGEDNGIEVAYRLKKLYPTAHFVFISNYQDFIFDTQILKPLCFIRKNCLEKDFQMMVSLLSELKVTDKNICFHIDKKHHKEDWLKCVVNTDKILYVEAFMHKIIVHTSSDEFVADMTMKEFIHQTLDCLCFVQVHKSYTVNMNYIYKMSQEEIKMIDDNVKNEIPIGRRYKKDFDRAFENFVLL